MKQYPLPDRDRVQKTISKSRRSPQQLELASLELEEIILQLEIASLETPCDKSTGILVLGLRRKRDKSTFA